MAAKFIAIDGPEKGLEFTFEEGNEWIFGRDPNQCQFVLTDPKASPSQAAVRLEKDRYYIRNLSAENPTYVGDEVLQNEKLLHFGDRVKLGDTYYRFTDSKLPAQDAKLDDFDNFFEDTAEFSEDFLPGLSPEPSSKEEAPSEEPPKEAPPENSNQDASNQPAPPSETQSQEPPNEDSLPPENQTQEPLSQEPPVQETPKEDPHFDTIFEDLGDQDTFNDFSNEYKDMDRFILKVLAGPNTGAEFAMQKGRSYVIGTDVTGADIIFNDLSVSRHHARLNLTGEGEISIEDLNSRNGVIVDGQQIEGQSPLTPRNMVTLGTTTFVVMDREDQEETVVAQKPAAPEEKKEEGEIPAPSPPEKEQVEEEKQEEKPTKARRSVKESTFILTGVLFAVIVVLGIGAVTLFKTSPVERPKLDFTKEIQRTLGNQFPDIKYTYNSSTGTLFLVGHVLSTVNQEELLYNLNNLSFIQKIDNNVVVDDAVAQEMNMVLSRYPIWRSVNIHAPQPGRFVMSGYLPTRDEGAELEDFVNVQFPYVDRLTNYVVIEDDLSQDIVSKLHNYGFYSVQVDLANGEVSLTGYVNSNYEPAFKKTIRDISRIVGVRSVNNYVVVVGQAKVTDESVPRLPYESEGSPGSIGQEGEPEQSAKAVAEQFGSWLQDSSVVNITDYPNQSMDISHMYTISGYADQGAIGRAVVIKGRILTVGDYLNGMRVLAIFENFVFLEKNGLKYKIEFNR